MLSIAPNLPSRLRSRRLTFAVLAAWGLCACAQTPYLAPTSAATDTAAPPRVAEPLPLAPRVVQAPKAGRTDRVNDAADALGELIAAQAGPEVHGGTAREPAERAPAADAAGTDATSTATASGVSADATSTVAAAAPVDPDFVGPPEPPPPPPPPVVLFPHRLGEFPPEPASASAAPKTGDDSAVPDPAPPVLRSQLPAEDPAGESVWRLSYSGRAAAEERGGPVRACGYGTVSAGIGRGLACSNTGEVKLRESVVDLGDGARVTLVAQAKGTDATTVNGQPTAVDPYRLLPQFYTAVSGLSGLSVLDGATVWAGRRENQPFLMSSGLLPPNSPSMRFGVDNARFGDIALNYQYTARNDSNGQNLPSYHSLRTAPIATNDRGSVQLGFTRVEAQPLVQDTGSAWWASAMHEQKGVLAGTNRFGILFGEGARTAMTGYSGMGPALSRVRVADSIEWKTPSGFGGLVESSLQFDRSPVGTLQWTTTRLRPSYKANDRFKLTFEVAHDQISSGFGAGGQRTALTVAPTLTLGKAAGNANLRAFYTYSRANDVDGISFAAPADAWSSQTSGSVFGVQLNRRW